LEIEEIEHTRIVFNLEDFLGVIGGIDGLIFQLFGYFLAGIITFSSTYGVISQIYKVKSQDTTLYQETEQNEDANIKVMKLSKCDYLLNYLHTESFLSNILCCPFKRLKM